MVTLIVKLTRSFTDALPVTLDCLIIVKLVTGLTVITVLPEAPVEFSAEVTEATLVNVPFDLTLTSTHTSREAP